MQNGSTRWHLAGALAIAFINNPLVAAQTDIGVDPKHALIDTLITIDDKPRQVLMGFGASQPRDQQILFKRYGAARVAQLSDRVYADLGMNLVRLWVRSDAHISVSQMKSVFYNSYVDNGYLGILKASGVEQVLLAPARGESAPAESMQEYASKLATFIREIYDERDVRIDVTGIANEPRGFSPEQLSESAKLLRRELDSRRLTDVGIIGPEWASADGYAGKAVLAMKTDPDSWAGLQAVATHSYNMGANPIMENLIAGSGKEYWMTEAGRGLPRALDDSGRAIATEEEPGDTAEAATTAARFLSDMNHSVTHWIWFIGIGAYDQHPNKDSGQVLARPDDRTGGIKYNTKYYYLKQLRTVFDIGALFYGAESAREKRMGWTYGQKPAVTVAMAQNSDQSWGIGVINTTGIRGSRISQFFPASSYSVAIKLPRAASRLQFQIFRSKRDGYAAETTIRADRSGYLNVLVAPHELVTLRSR
ncbi:MAG: hypothetical protein ABTR92_14105 [Candidatus Accumulibacter phosphatis]|uniref:hypothetical protein n=1 Tax=Candidatus Accumulibacter sp. ACC012 TaxID=2823332 RepID=UPI0025BE1C2E|nr:hypothetical protein [Candidatus Accumulibacter sp. ACC012]